MWGNLRSIAKAGEGGLISKIGDVVAPKSQDEDDDLYESESGSGEYEDEEYEYYEGSENLEDFDDQVDYQDEGDRMLSPNRLNEGRAVVGNFLGGVLQKGKEKLSETARNLVEPDHVENQGWEEERMTFSESEPEGGEGMSVGPSPNVDVALSYDGEVDQDVAPKSQYTSKIQGEIPDLAENNSMDFLSFGDDDINDTEEDYFTSDQRNTTNNGGTNESTEVLKHIVPEQEEEQIVVDDNVKEEVEIEDAEEEDFIEHKPAVIEDAQIHDDFSSPDITSQMEENSVQVSEQEEEQIIRDDNVQEEVETEEAVEEDFIEHDSTVIEDAQVQNTYASEITAQIEDNSNTMVYQEQGANDFNDDGNEDNNYDLKEDVTASISDTSKAGDQDMTNETEKEKGVGIKEKALAEEGESSDLIEEDISSPEEEEELDTFEENLNGFSQNLHLNGDADHMMENGNDPSAIEILDETVGHAFNLQEIGLDRTIGHHLDIAEQQQGVENPELDETVGHAFNLSESGLDQTIGHHLDVAEQHRGVDNPKLDNTSLSMEQNDEQSTNLEEKVTELPIAQSEQSNTKEVEMMRLTLAENKETTERYEVEVSNLKANLESAQSAIQNLEEQLFQKEKQYNKQLQEFEHSHEKDKESLARATQETHAQEVEKAVSKTREDMEKYILEVQQELATQVEQSDNQLEQFRLMFEEAASRADKIEALSKKEATKHTHQLAEMEKRHSIALERVEKKSGKTVAALDDKDSQIKELNIIIKDMKNTIKQNVEEHEAVEDEADELHDENEKLKEKVEALEKERKQLKSDLKKFQDEHGKSLGVQIELQLLREERDREKEKVESLKETQNSNESTLSAERDAAKAAALDLEQRLSALQADLDLVKSDYERAIMANSNLQAAMESFQIERESELALLEESQLSSQEAIKQSNELALLSMRQENEAAMKEVQIASNKGIQNMMFEMSQTEQKLEEYRRETVNLRRSLDEAIHRLQTNQEDVIDRSLMKNILLDWHSKSGKARRDVLVVVASVLHFSEADKDKCGIGPGSSTMEKVVGAVAPPLTPAAMTAEELDGDNIREKWVNFLLAESGDGPTKEHEKKTPAPKMRKSRKSRTTQSLEL